MEHRVSHPQANGEANRTVVLTFGDYVSSPREWVPGLQVPLPIAEVARCLGKLVNVSYTVDGVLDSPSTTVRVLDFMDGDSQLPTPTIAEANDKVLDLGAFDEAAHAQVGE